MWVATTEKFEALCRTAALRESLAEVGVLVVDEIHMLGDATRGPVLRGACSPGSGAARRRPGSWGCRRPSPTRSRSPTGWGGLLRSSWRPSRLTWQLPVIPADRGLRRRARRRAPVSRPRSPGRVTRDGGSVIVFCGSKRNVRRDRPGDRGQPGSEHLRACSRPTRGGLSRSAARLGSACTMRAGSTAGNPNGHSGSGRRTSSSRRRRWPPG